MRVSHSIRAVLWQSGLGPVRKSIKVRLHWSASNPLAVHISFKVGSYSTIRWEVARDILLSSLNAPAGEGDIHAQWVTGINGLAVELLSPSGYAEVIFDGDDTKDFLKATTDLVPAGSEVVKVPNYIPKWVLSS